MEPEAETLRAAARYTRNSPGLNYAVALSQAISLKRIADALDVIAKQQGSAIRGGEVFVHNTGR